MNINTKCTNITLSPSISDYVSKRFEAIVNFFKNDATAHCDIELAKTTKHHKHGDIFKAEIHIVAKDKNFFASAEMPDLYQAIDMVREEMLNKVRSEKSKKITKVRRGGAEIKGIIKNQKNK